VAYMTFPRAAAVAEIGWSAPERRTGEDSCSVCRPSWLAIRRSVSGTPTTRSGLTALRAGWVPSTGA